MKKPGELYYEWNESVNSAVTDAFSEIKTKDALPTGIVLTVLPSLLLLFLLAITKSHWSINIIIYIWMLLAYYFAFLVCREQALEIATDLQKYVAVNNQYHIVSLLKVKLYKLYSRFKWYHALAMLFLVLIINSVNYYKFLDMSVAVAITINVITLLGLGFWIPYMNSNYKKLEAELERQLQESKNNT